MLRSPASLRVVVILSACCLALGCPLQRTPNPGNQQPQPEDPAPPTAAFGAAPVFGPPPLTVAFLDQSNAGGAPIVTWFWDFGDGSSDFSQNPVHTYTRSGTYTVSLEVTTRVGTNAAVRTDYIVVAQGPRSVFSATPLEGEAPLTVNFTDESIDGTSPITSREWSFGDGGVSDESDPVHVYDLPGTYTVSLIVGSEHGSNASIREDYITVTEAGLEGEGES